MNWKQPDYVGIFQDRLRNLQNIRQRPEIVPALKMHYRNNPIDFMNDWAVTYDPRLVERGLPAVIPLILFPRQREFVEWVLEMWRGSESGVAPKSRDMGLSVVCQCLGVTLALFNENMAIGYGSRKEDLVDKAGDPDCLFYKGRMMLEHLPAEFRGGYIPGNKDHTSHLKIEIPETHSVLKGEAGDNIGRGGRASIYFTDEDAFIARPHIVDAALSQTTNCRIGVSSVNGMDNPFATKVHSFPAHRVFQFHWRDDPRKDDVWYAKQKFDLPSVIVAQELDLDFSASKEGILIPSEWVQAAIDAHIKLGLEPEGETRAALDVADEGIDLNAWAKGTGIVLQRVKAWSGKGSDTFATTEKAFDLADLDNIDDWLYDADGLGTNVRGDARVINERRKTQGYGTHTVTAFRGSGAVINPEGYVVKGSGPKDKGARKNKDFFENFKAQAWWSLRGRFQATYRAVVEGLPYDKADIISLCKTSIGADLTKLVMELSQPTYYKNGVGKILVNKAPDGTRSPNHADAVMMAYAPRKRRGGLFQ
jgi:phage terminase large subunit